MIPRERRVCELDLDGGEGANKIQEGGAQKGEPSLSAHGMCMVMCGWMCQTVSATMCTANPLTSSLTVLFVLCVCALLFVSESAQCFCLCI